MEMFLRKGRGLSFHEVELALGPSAVSQVVSSMQLERRWRQPVRALARSMSSSGRIERVLSASEPTLHRAWLQPFLYLTIKK